MDLRDIQTAEAEDSRHYFPDYDAGHLYLAVALAGEVGEACNDIKKYERGSISFIDLHGLLQGELADILIYLVMLADHMKIDLLQAYVDKKEYNERRYRSAD